MIQEANVGCGLFGPDGSQAAMSTDYAFGQFRFLTKLLLVHGRRSYQRVADMHANFFYNYLRFNGFNATYLYHYTFILLCNLLFTSLPVIVLGAIRPGYQRARGAGLSVTCRGTARALTSLADFGTTVAVSAILTANAFVGLNMNSGTSLTWITVFGSTIVMLAWIVVFSFFPSVDFMNEVQVLFGELTFWTTVVVTSLICLAPRFIAKYYSTVYNPLDEDIVREMWVVGDLKDQLGLQHRNGKRRGGAHAVQEPSETAPMFYTDHARSVSDINQYEPAKHFQPRNLHPPPFRSHTATGRRPTSGIKHSICTHRNPNRPRHRPAATRAPQARMGRTTPCSELPPPSPQPSPKYRLPSGEITSTPPSRRSSIATTPAARARCGGTTPTTQCRRMGCRLCRPTCLGGRLSPPAAQQHFEMNAMSSRGSAGHGGRTASQASYASHAGYATAPEGSYGGHEDDIDAEMDPGRGQQQYYAQGYQQGELDVHGYGYGAHDHDPNQRASRASEMSWDGPRAM
ncbi:hypothetical protein B0H14DRAFT_3175767 [Mycena olivaceomarginata]|nr:hypothetical protein B0H14DRAFT_3175767 [Mycena olivaceomarginata]